MVILTPKMVKNYFEIISDLTAVKNHTINFAESPFGPDYCLSSSYKYQNVPILVIFCHQLAILCIFKHATKIKINSVSNDLGVIIVYSANI